MSPSSISHLVTKVGKGAGLVDAKGRYVANAHGLQHSTGGIALAEGVPLTVVSAQIRHSRPSFTAERYSRMLGTPSWTASRLLTRRRPWGRPWGRSGATPRKAWDRESRAGEHQLDKLGVTGSSPVTPTRCAYHNVEPAQRPFRGSDRSGRSPSTYEPSSAAP